jgi:hypothetical protein
MVRSATWGPYEVADWKRPALLALSILVMVGLLALGAWAAAHSRGPWLWLLILPLLALCVLGIVTARRGCSDCVSRVFGGI